MASTDWTSNPLGKNYFHRGSEMQNKSHWKTHCKGCVERHLNRLTEERRLNGTLPADAATRLVNDRHDFAQAAGVVRGEKSVWITHILGSTNARSPACPWASPAAKVEATTQRNVEKAAKDKAPSGKHSRSASTADPDSNDATVSKKLKQTMLKTYTGLDMPFSSSEVEAIEAQALRTIVSTNSAFRLFEDPEMLTLLGMMRSRAPEIIPSRKVIAGRLLDEVASTVEQKLFNILKGQALGAVTDGWKSLTKDSVSGVCVNVEYKSYTIELVDVTSIDKSGPGMCKQFCDIIDRLEAKYGCKVIYFVTDADGGSKKGRVLLGKQRLYLILPSCWAHQFQLILGDYFKVNKFAAQTAEMTTALIGWINNHGKVRKIFDLAQRTISKDRLGFVIVLAYLVANLTRWTTHCIAFMRVFRLQDALQFAVMQSRGAIISAHVGAAKGAEKLAFADEAAKFCDMILDPRFWSSLESLIEDIEPICYGTNINQKDSTRADQVLLSLAGMFLRMVDHPEPEVAAGMTTRLEKRWKDCDQPLFLLALILNPFEQLSCFGPKANLNHFNCLDLLVSMYQRMNSRPDNKDTPAERKAKEDQLSTAFLQYLSGTGPFTGWKEAKAKFEQRMGRNPIAAWVAFGTPDITELVDFAILLLKIVVNQAGCERVFSDIKVKQTQRRNRLKLAKLDKMTKIGADIKADHLERGLTIFRDKRKVHTSTAALLTVPRYRDLLDEPDDDNATKRTSPLVLSGTGWRTVMAKWIGDAQAAEAEETDSNSDSDDEAAARPRDSKWKKRTLAQLFGGSIKKHAERLSQAEIDAEAELMVSLVEAEALADAEEDARLDDGAVEVGSEEEYVE
ncbi:ribonuclease H-like domain-containing protein [Mycena leptocephala]|nr:ribonuclease H-like domain-containing protein [Mycena leptocephala]